MDGLGGSSSSSGCCCVSVGGSVHSFSKLVSMSSSRSFGYLPSDGIGMSFMAVICSGLRVRHAISVLTRSRSSNGMYLHHS